MKLSKSKFVAGVQCLKRVYWEVHEPELAAEPDDATQAILEQGQEVGRLAQQAFPGGVEVEGGREDLDRALRHTRELISNPGIPAIFEATFERGDVLVRVDVLQCQRDGRWRLIEVKSSTDLKDHYVYDVGIQRRVLSRCGLDVSSAYLMHLNREYVYRGGSYDLWRLFRRRNLNRRIAKLEAEIKRRVTEQFRILNQPKAPDVVPGRQCREPFRCEFFACCNPAKPPDHVTYLPGISTRKVEKLAAMRIESVHDMPDDFRLSERQRRACTCMQRGIPYYGEGLGDQLKTLRYPLYFMDFETVSRALPPHPGMRPFAPLPFQWSVHVKENPGAKPEHHEFLATSEADPRRDFLASLCSVLGERGSIVVYNQGFESGRLADLARWVPEFGKRTERIQKRLWDLLPVVRDHVYHPAFAGSFSLKAVLPALVPEMTYSNMEVAKGTDAGLAWEKMVRGNLKAAEENRLRNALLAYCRQDTLAMVLLVKKLQSVH